MIAGIPRGRRERPGIRAGRRLGQTVAADLPASRKVGEILAFLTVIAERQDRIADQRVVDRQDGRDRRFRPRDLLHDDAVRNRVHPAPAVRFRDEDTHQPQIPQFADQLGGVAGGPVHLGGQRQEPSGCPFADCALDEAMFLAQFKFHPTTSGSVFVQDADASCGRAAQNKASR